MPPKKDEAALRRDLRRHVQWAEANLDLLLATLELCLTLLAHQVLSKQMGASLNSYWMEG